MNYYYFSKNGAILPVEQAVVSLGSVEYSYGFGVYETIRVVKNKALFIVDHLQRLNTSAKIIDLQHQFTSQNISKWVYELIDKNEAQACNIKILLIGAEKQENAQLYIFCSQPLFTDRKLYRDGAHLVTYKYEREFPHAKTLNMLQSYLAYRDAKRNNAYDALLINRQGYITEGTRTNIFYLLGKTIVTPPESDILLGVTRMHVLEVARTNGFKVEHSNVSLQDLYSADGVFITSTSTKILPIRSINDTQLNPFSDELRNLINHFDRFLSDI